jgi:hypothetical protein
MDSCPGVMSNPYRADQSNYRPRADWLPACKDTLSNGSSGRSDWQTIVDRLPWLKQPATSFAQLPPGPSFLPLAVTQVRFDSPSSAPGALESALVYLTEGGESVESGARARAFLFQSSSANGGSRLIDLGNPTLDQVLARGARPGDRLCVYELDAHDLAGNPAPRLGCATIQPGNTTLQLETRADWQPDVTIAPLNNTSVRVTAGHISLSPGQSLRARLYPVNGPVSGEQTLALSGVQYMASFTLPQPAPAGYAHIWVDEPDRRREIVVAYGLGGSPTRRSIDSGAPVLSPDGQALLYGRNLDFAAGQFYTLQLATRIPSRPAGARLVGQAYRLSASAGAPDLSSASINFSYLGRDVPAGQNNPDWLKIYYLPPSGGAWQALPTEVDVTTNNAVASTRGAGLYALMIGIEIPLYQGVNYVVYPVEGSQPVRQALQSIEGAYMLVSTTAPGDGGAHRTFEPGLPDNDPYNTLKQLEFGAVYAIAVSRNVILRLDASGDAPTSAASAMSTAASPVAPATFDGTLLHGASIALSPGLPVIARVNGVICGGGHTVARNGQVRAIVQVAADGPAAPGCGGPGREVTFQAGARIWSVPWDDGRLLTAR